MSTYPEPDSIQVQLVASGHSEGETVPPLCPDCRDTGRRVWTFPGATVNGHCGCRVGCAAAEADYRKRYPKAVAS